MMRSTSDPIEGLKAKLLTDWQIFSEDELKAIDKECRQSIDREVQEAEESIIPENTSEVLFKDIYVCDLFAYAQIFAFSNHVLGPWFRASLDERQDC